jgi:hypothetical protein
MITTDFKKFVHAFGQCPCLEFDLDCTAQRLCLFAENNRLRFSDITAVQRSDVTDAILIP